MTPAKWNRVKELFDRAVALPPDERLGLVYAAESDPVVIEETARLLALEAKPDSPIDRLAAPMQQMAQSAADQRMLRAGQLLAGRYRIVRMVGTGGMGEVYEAEDIEEGEQVAVKTLRALYATASHAAWLRREVEAARRVKHPNVCRVYGFIQSDEVSFLTMEFLAGETLAALLEREGPFPERRALPLLRQIAAGLEAAHQAGVVHRDLKPGNVMIVPRAGGTPRVVITDFGLARQARAEGRNTASAALSTVASFGTPAYMAPEQIAGQTVNARADQYAFGVLAHEMLTGELPFADESALAMAVRKTNQQAACPESLAPGMRKNWSRTILRCLDPNPKSRFASVGQALQGLETRGEFEFRWKRLQRWLSQYPRGWRWAVAASVLAMALLGAGVRAWPGGLLGKQAPWEQAIYTLQSGEPTAALRLMEDIAGGQPLGQVEKAQRAMAWWTAGFRAQAREELGEVNSWLLPPGDRLFVHAVDAQVQGDPAAALALLRRRADEAPEDAARWADLAWFGNLQNSGEAAAWWTLVNTRKPDHPVALLRLAEAAASEGRMEESRDGFHAAQTYFRARGNNEMSRAVGARRGMQLLAAGDWQRAQEDLAGTISPGRDRCSSTVTLMAGTNDQFAAPMDPIPFVSSAFPKPASSTRLILFDDADPAEGELRLSFPLPPVRLCSAVVQVRIRAKDADMGRMNDVITFGVAPFLPSTAPDRRALWSDRPGLRERTVSYELGPALLAECFRSYAKEDVAYLDIHASDDTVFDFVRLTLIY
ncbi:MAG: serine/threonine-protein kinase [Acidobacteria bacterium]|nr:serine/threonine-protein kinase [Acidobacteriota bacterium]